MSRLRRMSLDDNGPNIGAIDAVRRLNHGPPVTGSD